jgi:preprotein translocase subunit SecG
MISFVLLAGILQALYCLVLFLTALFLILLVLIQRGRGGGLSGAFGGMGGQSAFGSKAGDTFTRITIVAATFWILLCIGGVRFLGTESSAFGRGAPARNVSPAPDPNTPAPVGQEGTEATTAAESTPPQGSSASDPPNAAPSAAADDDE